MEEELEESETGALAEDDPAKREEGVPIQDESESGKQTAGGTLLTDSQRVGCDENLDGDKTYLKTQCFKIYN